MRIGLPKLETGLILKALIQEREEDPKKTAKILKIDVSKLNEIMTLKFRDYTIDKLLDFIRLLGYDINITMKRAIQDEGKLTIQRK